jgi:8-amino-7-oxononanoate synthase
MRMLEQDLAARLTALRAAGLERRLTPPAGIDFASNDYLGLASSVELLAGVERRLALARDRDESAFAPAARLLRGTTATHRALEERLAAFKGHEAALLFPSGYQANVGLLTALLERGDRVLSDEQNHASLIDGMRLAGCARVVLPHLDLAALGAALASPHAAGRTFVVVESLYGMDGDLAPLGDIADLCERAGAALVVDDAHATGLYGPRRSSGWVEECGVEARCAAVVTTFGKALAVAGACVSGSRTLIDWLVSRCRGFVFTTAQPPLLLWAIDAALDRLAAEPERGERARALADRLRAALRAGGLETGRCAGPVVPVVLGGNEAALAAATALQARGLDVRAVRPPTVAPGTARLRISVHADRSEAEIDALASALVEVVGEVRAGEPCEVVR